MSREDDIADVVSSLFAEGYKGIPIPISAFPDPKYII